MSLKAALEAASDRGSTEGLPRNKTTAANTITITTHIIALAASIIARDTPYLKK